MDSIKKVWQLDVFCAWFMQKPKTRALINGQTEYVTKKQLGAGKLDDVILVVEGRTFKAHINREGIRVMQELR